MSRMEFGVQRSRCACRDCQLNCRHMPGFLIPADLERMVPAGTDPFAWAESNLLASPGAIVLKGSEMFRVHTLVPAVKADGSCIHLTGGKRNAKCAIHAISPFGCAFFDCGPPTEGLAEQALTTICKAGPESLYARLWEHLDSIGKKQLAPEILRERIMGAFRK
jgi:hypothetical protein